VDYVHGLLLDAGPHTREVLPVLGGLARAFGARAAGLGVLLDGRPALKFRARACGTAADSDPWPWGNHPDRWRGPDGDGEPVESRAPGRALLLVKVGLPAGTAWLAWLEDDEGTAWDRGEKAAWQLAGQVLPRVLGAAVGRAGWDRAVTQRRLQLKLEEAAAVTGRLAHDFGNVLTGVLGFAELALTQLSAGSAAHRSVSELHQAARHGVHLIQRLSLFSRRQPAAPWSLLPRPVLAEEAERLQSTWGPGTTLRLDLPPELPAVAVDAASLRQVVGPLLDNAREATGDGGEVVLVARPVVLADGEALEFLGAPGPGEYLEVSVTDTGSGISPEVRQRLLTEVFVTTKPGHKGLGLATVYGLLRNHRGGLQLGPGPRGGTTARAVFPRAAAGARAEPAPPKAPAREKLLLVDDDPLLREMACTVLDRAGYRVHSVADARQALGSYAAAGPDPFHLVVSDVVMPAMSGWDLAGSLYRRDPNVRVLFMTGQVPVPPPPKGPPLPRFPCLRKPFRPDGLLQAVRDALGRPTPRPSPPA
jgi:signal transduction histidine kinase/CheY-like chemotaxis protein